MQKVYFGVDELIKQWAAFKTVKFGLVTNDATVTADGIKSRLALVEAGLQIIKLFSPEHGIDRNGADGAFQNDGIDTLTGLPILSLYGDNLTIAATDLIDIDAVLFDIPDVGCRFYTYLWTMTHVMETCAANNKLFIILDRPDPFGGNIKKAEGPVLDEQCCSSFIGRWAIPVTHSCSLGELANYFQKTRMPHLQCNIIKINNWDRNCTAENSGWQFVATSPAIKNVETVQLYPGMGLLEGINVNEGRGTGKEFKVFGAPWMDADILFDEFKRLNIAGLKFNKVKYTPEWGMHAKELCFGLELSVIDPENYMPVKTGIEIIRLLLKFFPADCKERLYKTNANPGGTRHLDKLLGIENAFLRLKPEEPIPTALNRDDWETVISPYLLY